MPDRYVWTAADGSTVELSDRAAGYTVTKDATAGWRSPTYNFTTQDYAGIDGAEVQAIKAAPATPTLGLYVQASSTSELRLKMRSLVHIMRPKAGAGTLTVSTEDGSSRSLACYLQGGLEGDDSARYPGWFKAALKFYAPDPWWAGDSRAVSLGLGAGSNFFPFFPLALAPSVVQGQFTIDLSDSDAPTYPTWTVTGPGSSLVLTNETTGRVIQINTALGSGQSMTIDTRPGFQSVKRNDGTNLMSAVSSDPALWPLVEDLNVVSAALTGATTDSRITGTYAPRFAGI